VDPIKPTPIRDAPTLIPVLALWSEAHDAVESVRIMEMQIVFRRFKILLTTLGEVD
jgi:hypothetical protein